MTSQPQRAAGGACWPVTRRRAAADAVAVALSAGDVDLASSQVAGLPIVGGFDRAAIDRILGKAWQLSAVGIPPRGSVRARRVKDTIRLVRAAGDGWDLVARSDGTAVVLLEEAADVVIDVHDDALLPGLLVALTAAAGRSPQ